MSRRIVVSTIGAVVLAALVFVGGASAAKAPRVRSVSGTLLIQTRFLDVTGLAAAGSQAPTDAQCRAARGVPCYSPQEIRHAYGVDQLLNRCDQGSIPDVAWNADPSTGILIYLSFLEGSPAGYYFIGGTSEGSPSWAGVIADLDQLARHGIGLLDPYAYALGATGRGFHDVTVGNNSLNGVTGYDATPGWDLATGWGSPNLAQVFGGFGALVRGGHSMHALLARARR